MKIDKEKLQRLSEKSDEELWSVINEMAKKHGYDLPKAAPTREEMNKIRDILKSADKLNMRDAAKLVQEYKRRG